MEEAARSVHIGQESIFYSLLSFAQLFRCQQTGAFISDYKDGQTILILLCLAKGAKIRFSKSRLPLPAERGGAARVRTLDSIRRRRCRPSGRGKGKGKGNESLFFLNVVVVIIAASAAADAIGFSG